MNIAKGLQQDPIDLDPAQVVQGVKDVLMNNKPALSEQDAIAALTELQKVVKAKDDEAKAKEEAQMAQLGEQNQKEGDAFLAENTKKDGVVTLPSGLQYKVMTQGTGPKPAATDTVVCNYRGTLLNGQEFDSSYKRGQPATFPLNRVIKGWTEGVQLMPVGSKYQFFIPSALAYGPSGAGGVIGPNATLIFEVELVSIQGK